MSKVYGLLGEGGSSEACGVSLWTATMINDVRQEPLEFQIIIIIVTLFTYVSE